MAYVQDSSGNLLFADKEFNQPRQVARESTWTYAAAGSGIVNSNTAVTIKAAVPGFRNYISAIQLMAEVLGTATEFVIRDGAGGTVLWRTKISTAGLVGGLPIEFEPPLFSSVNTLLEICTLTASGTGAVYCNVQGFVST
jgi:hypothetical protein